MQTKLTDSGDFFQNPVLIEILKAQIGLTSYEALAFVSVLLGNEQATAVAEKTGIPRSKVYGALDRLEKKNVIIKNEKGAYQPNPMTAGSLKDQANAITKDYLQFIDTLHSYAIGLSRQAARLKEDIGDIFQKNGFKAHFPKKILSKDYERYLLEEIDHILMRILYRQGVHDRRIRASIREPTTSEVRRRIFAVLPTFVDLIGESTTSGIRVGVTILTEEKKLDSFFVEPLLEIICARLNCQSAILVLAPEISQNYIAELTRTHDQTKRDPSFKIKIILPSTNCEEEISTYIKNIDMQWRELKDKLMETEEIKETTKERIRNLIVRIDDLIRQLGSVPEEYRGVYQDIFLRNRRDLQTYESLTLSSEERIASWFRMLESKSVFELEEVLGSKKSLKEIESSVLEKEKELASFEEELYSLDTRTNPYKKYGYLVNPFSLMVPMDKPDTIIDQNEAKARMEKFMSDIVNGSESNLLLLIAKEGGGKSHFLNFYRSRINEKNYGKAIAIRIQCRPNRDLLDLYPQITTEIARVAKKEERLSAIITEILNEAGTPRIISDLMKILRSISLRISNSGHGPLFIFIDEFENALPASVYVRGPAMNVERGRIGTPQAISQLDSLTQLASIGFVVVFRIEAWEAWKDIVENKVNKYEKSLAIKIEDLALNDATQLILHRLESPQFRKQKAESNPPKFDENLVKAIWERTKGNPRSILRFANRAFRRAVTKGADAVSLEHLES